MKVVVLTQINVNKDKVRWKLYSLEDQTLF